MSKPQSYSNHVRVVPLFHMFVLPVLFVNVGWTIYRLFHEISFATIFGLILALALLIGITYARIFALAVQDRVIRLEMQLRLAKILPADLAPRIGEFTMSQLIGMRFASDQELPELARKVLADRIPDRKTIKKMVQNWQPDEARA
jgi:hypothetical protein